MTKAAIPRALILFAALILSACKTVPITPQSISGHYDMIGKPENLWYSGESLVLGENTFEYWLYSTLSDDPRLTRYPVSGRYTLDGATITFHDPAVLSPVRTITPLHKQFLIWTPKQRASYRDTAKIPEDVLIQRR